jgi:hypothetical protein
LSESPSVLTLLSSTFAIFQAAKRWIGNTLA